MFSLSILLSPYPLLFFIVFAGLIIGKINIKHISIGIVGVLLIAILTGSLTKQLIPDTYIGLIENAQNTMNIFSKLGTDLFVSVIGLQTGFSIQKHLRGSFIAFIIGGLMSISGMITMLFISSLDKTMNFSSLLGILCGALTSSPGLSSVCEKNNVDTEAAVLGYGCAYLLGVTLVIFFTQLFSRSVIPCKNGETKPQGSNQINSTLILITITALLGEIIGNIRIPFLQCKIGNTASILEVGLVVGFLFQKRMKNSFFSILTMNSFKNLGLVLFFTGTGFNTGIKYIHIDLKAIFYGALITLAAILSGYFFCKVIFSKQHLHSSFVIAGGMTSSPAYGALNSNMDEIAINHFSFAYFGALVSLITAIQIIRL